MNTNQTNGSPFQDAADQSGLDSIEILSSLNVSSRDMADGISADTDQPQTGQPSAAVPPNRPTLDDESAGGDDPKHSVEAVSSIKNLVNAMDSTGAGHRTGAGHVDEVIDRESRDRGAVEFRVTCSGSPVRRLRLTGNRYTFGSAEGCSIRLSDDTLRPMHAVLLRDASRVIVRAYSVPVQVNASRTTEANLRVGDVLILGQYQFELLLVKSAEMTSTSGGFSESHAGTYSGEPASVDDDRRDLSMTDSFAGSNESGQEPQKSVLSGSGAEHSSAGGPNAEEMLWRDRLRQEVDQWRERQIECDRREGRMDERESELRNRETELWSRAENLYRREVRLQSQETSNFQLYDEFSQRQQELLAIREEDHLREESDHAREVEIREQELQYRSQLEEATRRLHQSQQQAASAAESVAQMREQFEFLNAQIEQLSQQHLECEAREQKQRFEHEQLRSGLEQARDQAVQDHADSEMRRMAAEEQVAKLEEQIAQLRAAHGSSESEQLTQLSESEAAESLRLQVEELQQMVSDARNEAEVLRADHKQACSSVRELENIVSESEGWGDENREQLIAETGELKSALEKISSELDQANSELKQLREANEDLTRRLTEVKQERDQSRLEVESRPSQEEVESLRIQLDAANERIGTMQLDHQQTLVMLEAAEQQNEYRQSSNEPNANQADAVWEAVGNVESGNEARDSVQGTIEQKLGCQTVGVSVPNDGIELTQDVTPDAENPELGDSCVGNSRRTIQDADSLQMQLGTEVGHDRESFDDYPMIGDALKSELSQDLAAEDTFPAKSSTDQPGALNGSSCQIDTGDEKDDLSDTDCMPPKSENWVPEAAAGDERLNDHAETGDELNSVVKEASAGFCNIGREVDEFEKELAPCQSRQESIEEEIDQSTDQDMDSNDGTAVAAAGEAADDLSSSNDFSSDKAVADSELMDSDEQCGTVEAYINRLLKRVRGDAEGKSSDDDTSADAKASQEQRLEPLDSNASVVPTLLVPEGDADLDAMHELANVSARVASKRRTPLRARNIQFKGMIRLVYALGAIGCGAVCFVLFTGIPTYVISVMAGLVAAIYVREAMQLFQEANYQCSAVVGGLQDEGNVAAYNDESGDV